MRLDHLLSKEHTARPRVRLEVGELPRRALVSWKYGSVRPLHSFPRSFGNGDRHHRTPHDLASLFRFEGVRLSRRPRLFDGTPACPCLPREVRSNLLSLARQWPRALPGPPTLRRLSKRTGPARPLRTAERARAFLHVNRRKDLPSYKEPTVDALAPDADEGRGRLR